MAGGASLGLVFGATGGGAGATSHTVTAVGGDRFVANTLVMSTMHFSPGFVLLRSGDTVTLANQTTDAHTLSLVSAADVPKNSDQAFHCDTCDRIAGGHGSEQSPIAVVDPGKDGLNAPGDSILAPPGGSVSIAVTTKPGTYHFVCVFHPWMQGTLRVL